MGTRKETIAIKDKFEFVFGIVIEYKPHFGFATAYYNGDIIGQVELGRILEPIGDDDREWEAYEERYSEWSDEIKTNLIPICKDWLDKTESSLTA